MKVDFIISKDEVQISLKTIVKSVTLFSMMYPSS